MKYLIDVRKELVKNVNRMFNIFYTNGKTIRLTPEVKLIIHKTAEICKDTNIYIQTKERRDEFKEKIKSQKKSLSDLDLFMIVLKNLSEATSDRAALITVIYTFPMLDDYIRNKRLR